MECPRQREKKNMTLKVSIKVRGPTSQQYILSKATIYLEYMKGHLEVVGYR